MNIAASIAARKLLGMTAEEYNRFCDQQAEQLKATQQRAIIDCIRAGLRLDNSAVDAALKNYHTLCGK